LERLGKTATELLKTTEARKILKIEVAGIGESRDLD